MAASLTATYDATLARVILTASGLNATTASTAIVRWDGGEPQTTPNAFTVRGGNLGAVTAGVAYDYEYVDLAAAAYQLQSFNASNTLLDTVTASVTPNNSGNLWLKSVFRPYLNRVVTSAGWSEVSYAGRGTAFSVLGQSAPVVVVDVLSTRSFTLTLAAGTLTEDAALALFFAPGDIVFYQPPNTTSGPSAGNLLPASGYFYVAAVKESKRSNYGVHRYYDVDLVEVARPAAALVGYSATWAGIVANFATWTAVEAAFATWTAVEAYVNPTNTVVG